MRTQLLLVLAVLTAHSYPVVASALEEPSFGDLAAIRYDAVVAPLDSDRAAAVGSVTYVARKGEHEPDAVWPRLEEGERCAYLRVNGTLKAGRHDLLSGNEYYLSVAGATDIKDWKRFVVGPTNAEARLSKRGESIRHGEERSFSIDLPMKWTVRFGHRYIAIAWMEKDHGLGVGSIDTPVMFVTGGGADKVAATEWISVATIQQGPQTIEFGPTWTGGHMKLTIEWVSEDTSR